MTHTENSRDFENFGSLSAEVLEIDISALDSQGVEMSVSPSHVDTIDGFSAYNVGDTDESPNDGYVFGYNETSSELLVHNVTADARAANNEAVNTTRVTWWGRP